MYCPNCGKQNPDDAKFCESCGAPTAAAEAPKAAPPPPPPPPPQQPVYNQQPVQQYAPPQQTYYPPQQTYNTAAAGGAPVMSVGSYIGTMLLSAIPLVGFILLLVWAFGSDTNPNKKNFCRAYLILMLIGIVLGIIFAGVLGGIISNLINDISYY